MLSFLENQASRNINIPNSNVYPYKQFWLAIDTMNDQYHIFNKNDQKTKKRLQDILQTKERRTSYTL